LIRSASIVLLIATSALFVVALPARYAQLTATLQNLSPAQELVLENQEYRANSESA
jgi:hypothetical protein